MCVHRVRLSASSVQLTSLLFGLCVWLLPTLAICLSKWQAPDQESCVSPTYLPLSPGLDELRSLSYGVDTQQTCPMFVVAMLVKNEAANLEAHLPRWRAAGFTHFLIGVDDLTSDNSIDVISEALKNTVVVVYSFSFDGFGPSKTELLRKCDKHFPHARYVVMAEADQRPTKPPTLTAAADDISYGLVRQGKGGGSRISDDVLLNVKDGWRYMYRVHEVPVFRHDKYKRSVNLDGSSRLMSGIELAEVEGSVMDRLGGLGRYYKELDLLEMDYRETPNNYRLLYYMGVIRAAIVFALQAMSRPAPHDEVHVVEAALRLSDNIACETPDRVKCLVKKELENKRSESIAYLRLRFEGQPLSANLYREQEFVETKAAAGYYLAR
eukprot:GHVQ01027249.1.p1 GENE.GHVQ01027249.1~~GHVQ01027249.1.p1  ORF type:complete len:381 (+),score=42.24 GHVQ01027249.1:58-1200(+)